MPLTKPSPARSRIIAAIRGHDTAPELLVRSALHQHGLRFRLQVRDLPGRPDIVLPRHRMVILVHGCFWHRHLGCARSSLPDTNREWWAAKLRRNRARDRRNLRELRAAGWRVIVVWECQLGTGRGGTAADRASRMVRFAEGLVRCVASGSVARGGTVGTMARRSPPEHLADLANVGPATLADFRVLGIRTLPQLAKQDAFRLYRRLCRTTRTRHDPCCIDVFLSAIDQARGGARRPWWAFTAQRKRALQEGQRGTARSRRP